jgi:hypothetical protein
MWLAVGLACDFSALWVEQLSRHMEEHAISSSAVYCMIVECAEKLADAIDSRHANDKVLELDYFLMIEAATPLLYQFILANIVDVEYKGKEADWTDLVQKSIAAGYN